MIGNDVHQLLVKYGPSQPDGGAVLTNTLSAMLIGESGRGLFVINHHCLRFINLWQAGRTQRHKTWYVEYK